MRLTPLSKTFIAVVVLGVVGYTGYYYYGRGGLPFLKKGAGPAAADGGAAVAPSGAGARAGAGKAPVRTGRRIVVGVNDFGGAYPAIVANDGATPGPRSIFKQKGLDVEIKLIKGSKERLKAFDAGEVDVMLLSLDYLAGLMPEYRAKGVELRAFMMADWSRGNCGIVAKPQFKSIESLKTARIATTKHTPTHYLLLSLLARSNLKPADIDQVKQNLVFVTKTPLAGDVFQRGESDAVAIWEPYLSQAAASGKGKLLVSTETATNLIADVLYARIEFLKANEEVLPDFVRAWLEGVRLMETEPQRAVDVISAAFKQPADETRNVIAKIKPATFADNRAFFGLDVEDAPALRLFTEAARFWQREGWVKTPVDGADLRWMKALEAVAKDHATERVVEKFAFKGEAAPQATADPLLTKSISIYFASGSDKLDPNARKVVDAFAETLSVFQNAYVRVEGNTDAVGGRPANVALSKRRAMAVVEYLVARHKLEPRRFIAVGNGPDKPVGDNKTDEGRELNRRTEFKLIANR
ncbi:MAG TPA: phosphate ABC transporter substrate-binding/OmpA family protein [Polyangia bacterium]|jgi:outer membrane protein OmpA-like peptidoglycan-associated protein/ABC-type amino acid transport substrate-binding protein